MNVNQSVDDGTRRWLLPHPELARVFGGGIVPGSLILLGGDPGIGKSTLALQLADTLARVVNASSVRLDNSPRQPVLYMSAEETVQQLRLRAQRLGTKDDLESSPASVDAARSIGLSPDVLVWGESSLDALLDRIPSLKPAAIVVDSIQTVYTSASASAVGSVSQVKECAMQLLRAAKQYNIAIFLVGHVTKAGTVPA